jgi:hypothetical protein
MKLSVSSIVAGTILIGCLGFVILVVYINYAAKVRVTHQSNGRTVVLDANEAQVEYYSKFKRFATTILELDAVPNLSPRKQHPATYNLAKENFDFQINKTNQVALIYAVSRRPNLKSIVGAVLVQTDKTKEVQKIICVADAPGKMITPPAPIVQNNRLQCSSGTYKLLPGYHS